jgi:hypothetical protein
MQLHGDVFRAVVIITQPATNAGGKLFEVGYRDPPWGSKNEDAYK